MPYVDPAALASPLYLHVAEVRARHEGEARWREPLSASPAGRVILHQLPAGFGGLEHYHRFAEEWFIPLAGSAEFQVGDGEWTRADVGTIVFGPRQVKHALRVVGAEPLLMLCVVAPNVPDDEVPV